MYVGHYINFSIVKVTKFVHFQSHTRSSAADWWVLTKAFWGQVTFCRGQVTFCRGLVYRGGEEHRHTACVPGAFRT